jgi:hypothetical protein
MNAKTLLEGEDFGYDYGHSDYEQTESRVILPYLSAVEEAITQAIKQCTKLSGDPSKLQELLSSANALSAGSMFDEDVKTYKLQNTLKPDVVSRHMQVDGWEEYPVEPNRVDMREYGFKETWEPYWERMWEREFDNRSELFHVHAQYYGGDKVHIYSASDRVGSDDWHSVDEIEAATDAFFDVL